MAKSQPLAPLNVGNVVSAAVTLYRSHLKDYLGIAVRATLWQAFPLLAFIPLLIIVPFVGVLGNNPDDNGAIFLALGLVFLLTLVCIIVLSVIGFSRYLVNSALIARLAFQELINQPARIKPTRESLLAHKWSFFLVSLLVGLALSGIFFALMIGLTILLSMIAVILRPIINNDILAGIIVALIGIAAFIGGIFILILFISRWLIAEVPLAVESNINGITSMGRSWQLTQNAVFRVQGVVIVSFLITLPLLGVTSYIPQFFLIFLQERPVLYFVVYVISLLLGLGGNLLILPFWQIIKAVLYYDLRNRREGLNMTLRDS